MDKIKIKCPTCGLILIVEDNPANIGKSLTCPNCKTKHKYEEYKRYDVSAVSDQTEVVTEMRNGIGRLVDIATGKEYELKEGHNTVGRKPHSTPPKASIPIITDDLGFSRLHCSIDVMKGRDGFFHTYVCNAENKNTTFVDSGKLLGSDKIALSDGSIIMSSDTRLRFVEGRRSKSGVSGRDAVNSDDDATELE